MGSIQSISYIAKEVTSSAKALEDAGQRHPKLKEIASKLFEIARDVANKGISVIKAIPALVGVAIYYGAILVTAYYLTDDAEKQSMEAEFQCDEIDIVIITKILGDLETAMRSLDSRNINAYEIVGLVDKAIQSLERERKNIEERMKGLTTVKTQSQFFEGLSGGAGFLSVAGTGAICFLAGPAAPLLVAGTGLAIFTASCLGCYQFDKSKSKYRDSIKSLYDAREKAKKAEEKLMEAKKRISKLCYDWQFITECIRCLELEAEFQCDDMIITKTLVNLETDIRILHSRNINDFSNSNAYEIVGLVDSAIQSLEREGKNIEERMKDLTTGERRSEFLQDLSGVAGFLSIAGTGAICFLAGHAAPLLVAGTGLTIFMASGIGCYLFGKRKSKYRDSIKSLDDAREKTKKAVLKLMEAKKGISRLCYNRQFITECSAQVFGVLI